MKALQAGGYLTAIAALALAGLIAGCASTPEATPARDAEAKRFATPHYPSAQPAKATLYIYRPDLDAEETILWVNDRLIGATLPRTFFRVELAPGRHHITGLGYDNGQLTLETVAGEQYFVALRVTAGTSHFERVVPKLAKRVIAHCCGLMENWTPGQRPLIR